MTEVVQFNMATGHTEVCGFTEFASKVQAQRCADRLAELDTETDHTYYVRETEKS